MSTEVKKNTQAIVALGTNLGDRENALLLAMDKIRNKIGSIVSKSSVYQTKALLLPGSTEIQPDYLNSVVCVETVLEPEEVLLRLLESEQELGRIRDQETKRWSARVIDLDLIAYSNIVIDTPFLTIPHPEMHKRRFVLEPMNEICPNWEHPILAKTVRELLKVVIW